MIYEVWNKSDFLHSYHLCVIGLITDPTNFVRLPPIYCRFSCAAGTVIFITRESIQLAPLDRIFMCI